MKRSDFEIMAPVGSWESLYAAQQGGADAIYSVSYTHLTLPTTPYV